MEVAEEARPPYGSGPDEALTSYDDAEDGAARKSVEWLPVCALLDPASEVLGKIALRKRTLASRRGSCKPRRRCRAMTRS